MMHLTLKRLGHAFRQVALSRGRSELALSALMFPKSLDEEELRGGGVHI